MRAGAAVTALCPCSSSAVARVAPGAREARVPHTARDLARPMAVAVVSGAAASAAVAAVEASEAVVSVAVAAPVVAVADDNYKKHPASVDAGYSYFEKYRSISALEALHVPWIIVLEPPPRPDMAAFISRAAARKSTLLLPMMYL